MSESQAAIEIGIQRIYIKDISFESPESPKVFMEPINPEIHLDINTASEHLEGHLYEVVLTVAVTARHAERVIFLSEIEQAGIFAVKGAQGETLQRILAAYCPNILFPYVRETVDQLCVKGSFPALHLAPINFEALYLQRRNDS